MNLDGLIDTLLKSRRLFWLIVAVTFGSTITGILLDVQGCGPFYGGNLGVYLAAYGFLGLGILISGRLPENRIGWLVALAGFLLVLALLSEQYAECLVKIKLPGVGIILWLRYTFMPLLVIAQFIFLPHIFPNGRFVSRRWRTAAIAGSGIFIALLLFIGLLPGPMIYSPVGVDDGFSNPYGLSILPAGLLGPIAFWAALLVNLGSILIAIASLVVRWRRSKGDERQQIKLFTYFLALVVSVYLVLFEFFLPLFLTSGLSEAAQVKYDEIYEEIVIPIIFMGFPVTIGIAVFKYRLYDIDIIIRRTLSYALLTGLLAGVYFGGVVLLQTLFGGLAGDADSPLITVISTLAIAALFNPLRHRIQDFIDQRFYRQKYDAERTLAQFSSAARDEVDLGKLADALLGAVEETLRPERVGLWLLRRKEVGRHEK